MERISPGALAKGSSIAGGCGNGAHLGALALSVVSPTVHQSESPLGLSARSSCIDDPVVHYLRLAATANRECLVGQSGSRLDELPGGESGVALVRRGAAQCRYVDLPGHSGLGASGGHLCLACPGQAIGVGLEVLWFLKAGKQVAQADAAIAVVESGWLGRVAGAPWEVPGTPAAQVS